MLINWKFISKVVGSITVLESVVMLLSAVVSGYYGEPEVQAFLVSAAITFGAGFLLFALSGFKYRIRVVGKKESFLGVGFTWLLFPVFGALPFYFSGALPNVMNAFFEATSGITTTGATMLTNIDATSHGILFWRSNLQWLGGMGIIVFSLALLPLLGGEVGQLFDAETSGITHDKFRPRITQVAKRLWGLYMLFTATVILLLWLGPMSLFDAVCHGFSTISTGGFSTKQESLAWWHSGYVETVVAIFMVLSATNYSLLYFVLLKGKIKKFFKDEELRWFLIAIAVATLLVSGSLWQANAYHTNFATDLRHSAFQVISFITTTGFFTQNFAGWGAFCLIIFLVLMIVCGCAGSTSGGMKMVRAVVLSKNTVNEYERLVHPRAIIPVRLNGTVVSFGTVQRLSAFAFLYMCIILVSWGVLASVGLPFKEALSASVSAISNVGLTFGALGENGSWINLPAFAKGYLALLMIVGRLEIFTLIILFSPGFWKH
ncbi:MAG: TrkH family potassium uptake protein [Candidatus Symbiothrix sp.]|jgi:trk system potassium uptake protein TrkH|nr:TrkH family potassium uptake protein [Candidatus Symbiothrix sp.]